jgi:hypothetical protein
MRKKLIVALTVIMTLAVAGVAIAYTQKMSATIQFSKTKAGGPTAISSHFKVSDPGNTTPGQVGKPTIQIKRVDIDFPAGSKFNYKVLPVCTAVAYDQIVAQCKKAKLATGSTKIDGRGGILGLNSGKLTAYNAVNGLRITVSSPGTLADNTVLSPKFVGTKLVTQLPPALSVIKAFLTDFKLVIPIKKGHGKYYATLPKKCPKSKVWNIKTKYYLATGATFTTPGTKNKCTAAKKKK